MQNLGSVNRKFWYDISVYLKTVYYTDLRVFLYGPIDRQITPISNASKVKMGREVSAHQYIHHRV